MFGEDFVDLLVKETNPYGDSKILAKGAIPKSSCFHKWCHTNREELLVFLAIVVNMGTIRKSSFERLLEPERLVSEYTIFSCNIYKRPLLYSSAYVTFSRK